MGKEKVVRRGGVDAGALVLLYLQPKKTASPPLCVERAFTAHKHTHTHRLSLFPYRRWCLAACEEDACGENVVKEKCEGGGGEMSYLYALLPLLFPSPPPSEWGGNLF